MARGLDHIVHAVRDLDAAADLYRRAGFTVGARNRHPWGTHNCIVQFPGVFIELLAIGEASLIPSPRPRSMSFGGFTRDFLARGEGLSMLVLEGKGAAADARAFHEAGIGDFDVFNFEREAKRPDGAAVKVAFSLAFAADTRAPDIGYFTCQQHFPENFWNPAFQTHTNGVWGIMGVTLVAEAPDDHRGFLKAFSGVGEATWTGGVLALQTPRGDIQVMTPAAYRSWFAVEPPVTTHGARLAAMRFAAADKAAVMSALSAGRIASSERDGRVIVRSDAAHGATLIFEAA